MRLLPTIFACVFLVWAGLALGGNLIAAPAKFQADGLALGDLLQVGRAQFAWLATAEWGLASVAGLCACFLGPQPRGFAFLAIAAFGVQQLALQPVLQQRTDLILSGAAYDESHLHLVFILVEVLKTGVLLVGGVMCVALSYATNTSETDEDT